MEVFDWSLIPSEEARRGVIRKVFTTPSTMFVLHELRPGMERLPHSHPFDQVCWILQGEVISTVGEERQVLRAGNILYVPPDTMHYFDVLGTDNVLCLDVFSPPRADYLRLAVQAAPTS